MRATSIFSAPTMTSPARLTSDASSGQRRTSSKTGRRFRGGIQTTPKHSKPSYKNRTERLSRQGHRRGCRGRRGWPLRWQASVRPRPHAPCEARKFSSCRERLGPTTGSCGCFYTEASCRLKERTRGLLHLTNSLPATDGPRNGTVTLCPPRYCLTAEELPGFASGAARITFDGTGGREGSGQRP